MSHVTSASQVCGEGGGLGVGKRVRPGGGGELGKGKLVLGVGYWMVWGKACTGLKCRPKPLKEFMCIFA
jgi:hypothetical protein